MLNKVIITGATGMIGATLIKLLIKENVKVIAIVRPNSKKIANIPVHSLVNIVKCNASDYASLSGKLGSDNDMFFHFAWDGTYGSSRDDIILQESNVCYTLDAVNLAASCGCKTFVGAGSQAEYGFVDGIINDSTPNKPVTGYGISKYAAGRLSALLCKKLGIKQSWGRIISAYGPMDNDYTMIMSGVIGMIKGERRSFTKGEQIWDYVYSEDCANAFKLIGEYGKDGAVYNIASGKNKTLREYITIMRDVINPSLELGFGEIDYYPNQVMKLVVDISKLTKDTGYKPSVTFEEGIKACAEWVKERKDL